MCCGPASTFIVEDSSTLKIKTGGAHKTMVMIFQIRCCYIPEYNNVRTSNLIFKVFYSKTPRIFGPKKKEAT
jgi:hypothetical protein